MKYSTVEVPHLGTSVQVHLIPPKLLRAIQTKVTKDGRIDFQELMVWKLVYGLRDPNVTEAEARRLTQRFTLRVLQPILDEIDRLSGTDEHLGDSDRPAAIRKITEPMTMATAWLDRFPDVVPTKVRSRESHGSQPGRRRGSRRGERATSSSSDDPDPDPEPADRRLCENERCRADISHLGSLAYHCDNACKQAAWRDRRTRELLDEIVGTMAEGLSCTCSPEHNVTENEHCLKCGYPRGVITRAWVNEDGVSARSFVVTRGLPPRKLKIRPDRELSKKLRKTRGRWDKPSREEVAA